MDMTLFDPGPFPLRQTLVLGTLGLLLAFALWRMRGGAGMQFSHNGLLNAVGWLEINMALPGAVLFLMTLLNLFHLTLTFPTPGNETA